LDGFLEEAASILKCLLPGILRDAAVKHMKASKHKLAGFGMMLLLGILEGSCLFSCQGPFMLLLLGSHF
jgi:hypothetical protein